MMQPNLLLSFAWFVLLHSAVFCLYWMTNRAYHHSVDGFLTNLLGVNAPYVTLLISLGLFSLAFSLMMVLLHHLPSKGREINLPLWDAVFTALGAMFIVVFYGSFFALFEQDPTQLDRLRAMFHYFRLLVDAALLLGLAWSIKQVILPALIARLPAAALPPGTITGGAVVLLGTIWLLPLLYPPGAIYQGQLPPKPRLIAHRGAAWLAPENTLSAMQKAVDLGAFGLESDVHVSKDGVLFLIHDQTLKRTTNITEIFPEKVNQHASSFTWDELSQLNAGSWFIQQDPYQAVRAGFVTESQLQEYARQPIPTLQELLDLVKLNGQILLYDRYDPPTGHPYHKQSLALHLSALQQAQLRERAWLLVSESEITMVRAALPEATLVAGIDAKNPPPAEQLLKLGYRVVNSEYPLSDAAIRAYRNAGLWVNLWTVDEPWLFSRAWLMGVDSITTNNLHTLQDLKRPILALPVSIYRILWGALGLLALLGGWFTWR